MIVDGFHWTRVTGKQLRFLYEDVTMLLPPAEMRDLAAAIDRGLEAIARSPVSAEEPVMRSES